MRPKSELLMSLRKTLGQLEDHKDHLRYAAAILKPESYAEIRQQLNHLENTIEALYDLFFPHEEF